MTRDERRGALSYVHLLYVVKNPRATRVDATRDASRLSPLASHAANTLSSASTSRSTSSAVL